MHDARVIPEDLESCQRLLREVLVVHDELTGTCTTLHDSREQLRQENEELQLTIKQLLHRLYGRRRERYVEGQGQQHFDFGGDDSGFDPSIVSAAQDDPIIQETVVRRRVGRKRRSEQLPEHLERRTQRLEPKLPAGIALEDCAFIGVDVVEVLQFDRGKLWVRRFEYPKYKLPLPNSSPVVEAEPLVEAEPIAEAEPVANEGCQQNSFQEESGDRRNSRPQRALPF